MSIKAYGKELFIGKERVTLLEFLEKQVQFEYDEIRMIEYQFADNSRLGFMRFKLTNGNTHVFPHKGKNNDAISRAINYIETNYDNVPLSEVSEKFGFNERFALYSIKKKAIPFLICFFIPTASFFKFMDVYSEYTITMSQQYITLDQYNQCKIGMSYQECVNIIGFEGEPLAETEIVDINTTSYTWYADEFGSNVIIFFMDDKLYSKSQIGLK